MPYLRSRLGMLLPEKYESIFNVSSKGPSSGSLVNKPLLNFPTKGLCSKRRRYFHIFQVEAYLTYSTDLGKVNSPVRDGNPVARDGKFLPRDGIPVPWDEKSIPRDSFFPWMDFPPNENH